MLILANALHIPLADESVQCVVTSPPYWGLRDYGLEPTIWGGDDPGCEHVWGEERLSEPRKASETNPQIQRSNRGTSLADDAGTRTSYCQLCGAWRGCLGLEPTTELYVEHLVAVFREVWRVLRPDGTVWLNLGDSYNSNPSWGRGHSTLEGRPQNAIPSKPGGGWHDHRKTDGLKTKDLVGIPWRVAFALQADGWWLRSEITWCKGAPMPESVTDRPTSATEKVFLLTKSARYYYDNEAVRVPSVSGHASGNGFKREARLSYDGRGQDEQWQPSATRNLWNYWIINPSGFSGAHFAVMPPALVEPCIKAGTSERGACPKCGKPWVRIVERGQSTYRKIIDEAGITHRDMQAEAAKRGTALKGGGAEGWGGTRNANGTQPHLEPASSVTLGWRPGCECLAYKRVPIKKWREVCRIENAEPVPCIVLDPFAGSGTAGRVAARFGRSFVGLDLQPAYLPMARERTDGVQIALAGV